jgi:hypothetical protein
MRDELSATSAAALVLGFMVCVGLGWMVGSLFGAFVGAIVSATIGIVATSGRTFSRGLREREPIVDASALPPRAALALMSAGPTTLQSELLGKLDDIRRAADDDPQGALARTIRLRAEHPHTPAVNAQLARCHLAVDQHTDAMAAATEAIRSALDGGMNPTAAQLWSEFEMHREQLALSARHLERLARVLEHRGDADGARWCRGRAEPSSQDEAT